MPTLDEEAHLDETLRRAESALGPEAEVIVVDGGSRDRTAGIAAAHGRVLSTRPNRGAQLAAGARAASGEILIFLHADTWLPDGAATAIRAAVRAGAEAGCFRFALDPHAHGWRYRLLEWGVNWRTRRLHTATGDQALFATRDAYDGLRGLWGSSPLRGRDLRPGRSASRPLPPSPPRGAYLEPALGSRLPSHGRQALGAAGGLPRRRRPAATPPLSRTARRDHGVRSPSVPMRSTNQRLPSETMKNGTLTAPFRVPVRSTIQREAPPAPETGFGRTS